VSELILRFGVVWRSIAAQTLGVAGSDPAWTCSDIVTSWMEDQAISNCLVSQGKGKGKFHPRTGGDGPEAE
jgi:hypothetical protein